MLPFISVEYLDSPLIERKRNLTYRKIAKHFFLFKDGFNICKLLMCLQFILEKRISFLSYSKFGIRFWLGKTFTFQEITLKINVIPLCF